MNQIYQYSNPQIVYEKAKIYLGDDVILSLSDKPKKKYMVYNPNTNKWVYFGQMGFSDFTKHQDIERRNRYLSRATKIKGNWRDNLYSPNNLAIHLLW